MKFVDKGGGTLFRQCVAIGSPAVFVFAYLAISTPLAMTTTTVAHSRDPYTHTHPSRAGVFVCSQFKLFAFHKDKGNSSSPELVTQTSRLLQGKNYHTMRREHQGKWMQLQKYKRQIPSGINLSSYMQSLRNKKVLQGLYYNQYKSFMTS